MGGDVDRGLNTNVYSLAKGSEREGSSEDGA